MNINSAEPGSHHRKAPAISFSYQTPLLDLNCSIQIVDIWGEENILHM